MTFDLLHTTEMYYKLQFIKDLSPAAIDAAVAAEAEVQHELESAAVKAEDEAKVGPSGGAAAAAEGEVNAEHGIDGAAAEGEVNAEHDLGDAADGPALKKAKVRDDDHFHDVHAEGSHMCR